MPSMDQRVALRHRGHSAIGGVPPELLVEIASYLPFPDVLSLRRTDKNFFEIAQRRVAGYGPLKRLYLHPSRRRREIISAVREPAFKEVTEVVLLGRPWDERWGIQWGQPWPEADDERVVLTERSGIGMAYRELWKVLKKLPRLRTVTYGAEATGIGWFPVGDGAMEEWVRVKGSVRGGDSWMTKAEGKGGTTRSDVEVLFGMLDALRTKIKEVKMESPLGWDRTNVDWIRVLGIAANTHWHLGFDVSDADRRRMWKAKLPGKFLIGDRASKSSLPLLDGRGTSEALDAATKVAQKACWMIGHMPAVEHLEFRIGSDHARSRAALGFASCRDHEERPALLTPGTAAGVGGFCAQADGL